MHTYEAFKACKIICLSRLMYLYHLIFENAVKGLYETVPFEYIDNRILTYVMGYILFLKKMIILFISKSTFFTVLIYC